MLPAAVWLAAGQPADATVVRELERIEQRLASSWKTGDCDTWGSIVAPEWSVIHINATVIGRAQALDMCRHPETPMQSSTIDDVVVRTFGDTAIVTGRNTVVAGGAEPQTIVTKFTDVFVRRGGRWQVVASQATRVPQ